MAASDLKSRATPTKSTRGAKECKVEQRGNRLFCCQSHCLTLFFSEKDIDEVVQAHAVFLNVSKGKVVSIVLNDILRK